MWGKNKTRPWSCSVARTSKGSSHLASSTSENTKHEQADSRWFVSISIASDFPFKEHSGYQFHKGTKKLSLATSFCTSKWRQVDSGSTYSSRQSETKHTLNGDNCKISSKELLYIKFNSLSSYQVQVFFKSIIKESEGRSSESMADLRSAHIFISTKMNNKTTGVDLETRGYTRKLFDMMWSSEEFTGE
jgi:hypothetical protein